MVQFFGKFGDKPCCITDLKIYLHLLAPEQRVQVRPSRSGVAEQRVGGQQQQHTSVSFNPSQFINRLSEAVPLGERGEEGFAFPEDTRALQRHLCVCQLGRALGLHHGLDADGKFRLVAELKAHYRHGLKFGESVASTHLSDAWHWGWFRVIGFMTTKSDCNVFPGVQLTDQKRKKGILCSV